MVSTAPAPAPPKRHRRLEAPPVAGLSLGTDVGSGSGPGKGGSCGEEEEDSDGNGFWQQGRQRAAEDGASRVARSGLASIGRLHQENVLTSGAAGSDSSLDSKDQAAASEVTPSMQNGGREAEGKVQMLYIQMESLPADSQAGPGPGCH